MLHDNDNDQKHALRALAGCVALAWAVMLVAAVAFYRWFRS